MFKGGDTLRTGLDVCLSLMLPLINESWDLVIQQNSVPGSYVPCKKKNV